MAHGGHSISLVIQDDKDIGTDGFKGCIIDPNLGSLAFKDMDESKELLKKLLSEYDSPPLSLSSTEDHSHHNIRILHCVPKENE